MSLALDDRIALLAPALFHHLGADGVYAPDRAVRTRGRRPQPADLEKSRPSAEIMRFPPVMSRMQLKEQVTTTTFPASRRGVLSSAWRRRACGRRLGGCSFDLRFGGNAASLLSDLSTRGSPRFGAGEGIAVRRVSRLFSTRAFPTIRPVAILSDARIRMRGLGGAGVQFPRPMARACAEGWQDLLCLSYRIDKASDPFLGAPASCWH